MSTFVLQEYFVPCGNLVAFVHGMAEVIRRARAHVLNVSIRHSPADSVSLMPWAKQEVFSLVLYAKQGTDSVAARQMAAWTSELIKLALRSGGRYYLPYQLHATQAQFKAAYPEVNQLRRIKRQVDPSNRLLNELWRKYL